MLQGGQVLISRSEPCRGCDTFAVIDSLKQMAGGRNSTSPVTGIRSAKASSGSLAISRDPKGATLYVNGEKEGSAHRH